MCAPSTAVALMAVEESRFLERDARRNVLVVTSGPQEVLERTVAKMRVAHMQEGETTLLSFVEDTCRRWGRHLCPLRVATGLVLSEVDLLQAGDRHRVTLPTWDVAPADADESSLLSVYCLVMKGERLGAEALEPGTDGDGRRRMLDPIGAQLYFGESGDLAARQHDHEQTFFCPDGLRMRAGALSRAKDTYLRSSSRLRRA